MEGTLLNGLYVCFLWKGSFIALYSRESLTNLFHQDCAVCIDTVGNIHKADPTADITF